MRPSRHTDGRHKGAPPAAQGHVTNENAAHESVADENATNEVDRTSAAFQGGIDVIPHMVRRHGVRMLAHSRLRRLRE